MAGKHSAEGHTLNRWEGSSLCGTQWAGGIQYGSNDRFNHLCDGVLDGHHGCGRHFLQSGIAGLMRRTGKCGLRVRPRGETPSM